MLGNKRHKIAPFLIKLYDILNDDSNSNIICWNKSGNGFYILDFNNFCKGILCTHFKTNIFPSFVRQLNLYDFHKTRNEKGEYEFTNSNFLKNNKNSLYLIKRKYNNSNNNEIDLKEKNKIQLKSIMDKELEFENNNNLNYHLYDYNNFNKINKKIDLEGIKQKTKEISEQINLLERKVETLEGKHDFLEYCHSELSSRNASIKNNLIQLIEKEKNLENLFIYAMINFFPTNQLPDLENMKDQFIDVNKKEIINQIFKRMQPLCLPKGKAKYSIDDILSEENKKNLTKLVGSIAKSNNNSSEMQNEIKYFSQIKDFQDKYLRDLDDNSNTNNSKLIILNNDEQVILENNTQSEDSYLGKKTERTSKKNSFNIEA